MQQFFMWMRETHSKEFLTLVNEPYTNADALLNYAKEYAKQNK
jgi:hypothetical protein